MGPIHKRQSLKFQVLICVILGLFSFHLASAASKTESKDNAVSTEVLSIVQKSTKKTDFAKELDQIVKLKNPPVSSLIAIFQDSQRVWQERWFSGIALSKFPNDQTKQVLIKGSKDTLSIIRAVSMQSLAVFDDDATNKVLQDGLNDSALIVRDAAVTSLGKIKDRNAVDLLAKELFDKRNYYRGEPLFQIRENVVKAMGDIGSMKSVDPLIKLVQQDSNDKIHTLACASLEKIVKPETSKKELEQCPSYWISWYKTQNVSTKK